MTPANDAVFLLDVDNTLLDNDRIVADLNDHLRRGFGGESRDRYWKIFEALRVEAAEGRVLIYLNKEQMLKEVESRYPARHYVMVDDKLRIWAAMS